MNWKLKILYFNKSNGTFIPTVRWPTVQLFLYSSVLCSFDSCFVFWVVTKSLSTCLSNYQAFICFSSVACGHFSFFFVRKKKHKNGRNYSRNENTNSNSTITQEAAGSPEFVQLLTGCQVCQIALQVAS